MEQEQDNAYHDLLRLGEVVGRVSVQLHHTQLLERGELLGDDLGSIKIIKVEAAGLLLVDDLDRELPLGAVTGLDSVPQILSVHVGVLA